MLRMRIFQAHKDMSKLQKEERLQDSNSIRMQITIPGVNFDGYQTKVKHRQGSIESFQRVILNVFILDSFICMLFA